MPTGQLTFSLERKLYLKRTRIFYTIYFGAEGELKKSAVTNATLWISRITAETSEITDIKFSMRPTVPLLGEVPCQYHANIAGKRRFHLYYHVQDDGSFPMGTTKKYEL
jgi:hypothetical protein